MPDIPPNFGTQSAPQAVQISPLANATPETAYDEVPYESHPFAQSHPSRLFTVATLFGMRPAPVSRCRVLELGCAGGGNLLPMADYLPDSQFVGVDGAGRQIQDGLKIIQQLGLKNISLIHGDILDVDAAYGTFDYIIVHGVYSWVPDKVRDKIMHICGTQLNQNGVAYISFNTYPGWHMRGMIRDMMRYHASRFTSPQIKTQQARALLDFLAQSVKQEGPYSQLLKMELETLRHQADYYLYHEHLEDINEPCYFYQFVERARSAGLNYLGEARIGSMVTGNFGPDVEKTLKMLATDQIQVEQYMDFLRNRMFRETLLCSNRHTPNWTIAPDSLRSLHIASGSRPDLPEGQTRVDVTSDANQMYKTASGFQIGTNRPLLKAALQLLQDVYPGTIPFETLRREARKLIGGADISSAKVMAEDTQLLALGLLNCYMTSDMVEFHGMPIAFLRSVSERPVASELARITATKGGFVSNRRHEVIRLSPLDRQLIPLLDGTHDAAMLVDKATKMAMDGIINVHRDNFRLMEEAEIRDALVQSMPHALENIARLGVLVA